MTTPPQSLDHDATWRPTIADRKKLSTVLTFLLVCMVVAMLASIWQLNDATLNAVSPGASASLEAWRRFTILTFCAALGSAAVSFVSRPSWQSDIFQAIFGMLALSGFLTEPGIFGPYSHLSSNLLSDILAAAVIGGAVWPGAFLQGQADSSSLATPESRRLWLAGVLYAACVGTVVAVVGTKMSWPMSARVALLVTMPQWALAIRSSRGRATRAVSFITTAIGASVVVMLTVIMIIPVPYLGFLGASLLSNRYGLAFCIGGVACAALYLTCGSRMRLVAGAPRSDLWAAGVAGIALLPVVWALAMLAMGKW